LAFASWWDVAKDALAPDRHGMQSPALTHACEYESSLVMALRGDLVHLDRAQEAPAVLDNQWTHSERGGKVRVFHRFSRFTAAGNMGQPRAATAEKGKSIFAAVVAEVCAMLTDFATWPELPAIGPK
jgi:creatinine amidohydrolase